MTATLLADITGSRHGLPATCQHRHCPADGSQRGLRYHLRNLAGADELAVNGASHHAWPSTVRKLVWPGIGLITLPRTKRARTPTSTPHPAAATDR